MARVKGEYIPFKVLYDIEDRKLKYKETIDGLKNKE